MKNLSHMSMLLAALLALSLLPGSAAQRGQGDQDEPVGIVRNATMQYVDTSAQPLPLDTVRCWGASAAPTMEPWASTTSIPVC